LTTGDILEFANTAGVIALLVIAIITGLRGYWVFGWVYRDCVSRGEQCQRESDQWKNLALRGSNLAERIRSLSEE